MNPLMAAPSSLLVIPNLLATRTTAAIGCRSMVRQDGSQKRAGNRSRQVAIQLSAAENERRLRRRNSRPPSLIHIMFRREEQVLAAVD